MAGKVKQRFSTKESFNVGHHHRCYRNKATERFLLFSRRGVEFLDLSSGENHLHHWARGACLHGIVPCNGLLYLTPHPCDCYIATKLNGYFALAPQSGPATSMTGKLAVAKEGKKKDRACFERGPAYEEVRSGQRASTAGSDGDWPTFRHDSLRSGSTNTTVPAKLKESWRADVRGRLSPPVVAQGKLFVASIDEHRVAAFDAASGEAKWSFTAGGRVDTPPTIYRGLVLFGSADGWVYCLRASDGKIVWRRRAAPQQRLVGAFGQLESAWPVHGSVLLRDDSSTESGRSVAYLAAGRSSYLDGGIYLYALDPMTGKVLDESVLYSPDPETGKMPPGDAKNLPGVLADILVSDGSSVYMRQQKVFARDSEEESGTPKHAFPRLTNLPHLFATGGFRDASWFNRTQWAVGAIARAQLLVFNEQKAYGIRAYPNIGRYNFFHPGGEGYLLYAGLLKAPSRRKPSGGRDSRKKKTQHRIWSMRVPIRATAMVLAGGPEKEILFIAGPPDEIDPQDSLAAFEGRKGARLWAISEEDGVKLAEYGLKSPPVFDGMIAAHGRLYISMDNGGVICMEKK
jgi:outer membrane protein assembly factor BamB